MKLREGLLATIYISKLFIRSITKWLFSFKNEEYNQKFKADQAARKRKSRALKKQAALAQDGGAPRQAGSGLLRPVAAGDVRRQPGQELVPAASEEVLLRLHPRPRQGVRQAAGGPQPELHHDGTVNGSTPASTDEPSPSTSPATSSSADPAPSAPETRRRRAASAISVPNNDDEEDEAPLSKR